MTLRFQVDILSSDRQQQTSLINAMHMTSTSYTFHCKNKGCQWTC